MIKDIFIGVDGGGTKSKIRIEDSEGHLLAQALAGSANIRLSTDIAWQSIYQGLQEAFKSLHLSLDDPHTRFHLGLGLAGVEMIEACRHFLQKPHSFTTLQLISDAHAACLGAHTGKDGAIIIVGTGIVGYQIEGNHHFKSSGWGFPVDDEGSGAWLGLEAARLTCHWLDHRSEVSPLVEDIFAFFNKDIEQFTHWVSEAHSSEFAKLAPIVINHSQQQEVTALRLMKKAAHAVEQIGLSLAKMSANKKLLPYSLCGGIAPFLEPYLNEEMKKLIIPKEADASVGAILFIKNALQTYAKVT